jgi:hypothetical protein
MAYPDGNSLYLENAALRKRLERYEHLESQVERQAKQIAELQAKQPDPHAELDRKRRARTQALADELLSGNGVAGMQPLPGARCIRHGDAPWGYQCAVHGETCRHKNWRTLNGVEIERRDD